MHLVARATICGTALGK